eukprot:CAMPEP_0169121686 /NCGR_PEP_ID=MMETSP1015-20121227/32805_1 /TAXON_ID=342587 /ORGANISM="Karlodinium micrum, Strain CCMP2283" /LENGTH=92 /DNA_ID=CAMNT_0009184815 /DNA_START=58 /DNA_END=336 /DNA_ORIENTATION=+
MAGDSPNSGSNKQQPSSAVSIGGARQVAKRGGNRGAASSGGKKASGGSMLNYSSDATGLKLSPTTILVMALAFMAIVCFLHIVGKFRSAAGA